MKTENNIIQKRLYLIAVITLILGLGSSAYIYMSADSGAGNAMIDEFQQSKAYRHEIEVFGGKMNLLATDFIHWFDGLWQGKPLAYTVAVITLFVFWVISFVARHLPAYIDSTSPDVNIEQK